MNIFKTVSKIFFCLSLLLPLAGCWDIKDINHRALPLMMGIAKNNDHFIVILQIPIPTKDGAKYTIVKGIGPTVSKAVENIRTNTESSIDLLHLKLIIFEKNFAEEQGIQEPINTFIRIRDISPKTIVAISDEPIDYFFEKISKGMENQGTFVYDFFEKNAGWTPEIALTRVWEIFRSMESFTQDTAVPIVKSGKNTIFEYVGSALFKRGKLVSTISPNQTLLYNAFHGNSVYGKIEVMKHANVMIVSNSIKHDSQLIGDTPHINSVIKLKVVLQEVKGNPSEAEINKEMQDVLTKRLKKMLVTLQEDQIDLLGLGQYFRNQLSYEELKNWRSDYYPKLKMNFRIKTQIQDEGNLKYLSD